MTDCRVCLLQLQCIKTEARHVTRLIDEAALDGVRASLELERLGSIHGTARLLQALA